MQNVRMRRPVIINSYQMQSKFIAAEIYKLILDSRNYYPRCGVDTINTLICSIVCGSFRSNETNEFMNESGENVITTNSKSVDVHLATK